MTGAAGYAGSSSSGGAAWSAMGMRPLSAPEEPAEAPPSPSSSSSSSPGGAGLYHERQRLELCALHALNNVLQGPCFSRAAADAICKRLAPGARPNPHRSLLGTGNYDVNVIMAALESRGLAALWWDKRRPLEQLVPGRALGLILNVPARRAPGPLRRHHWVALRQHRGTYFNLDSKLRAPAAIGGEPELRAFLQERLARGPGELLLVVPREVEAAGSWLRPAAAPGDGGGDSGGDSG